MNYDLLGGVNWLTVGKMSDHNGDVDRVKLLSKLQDIILRLDRSNSNRQLTSVESAKDYLQEVLLLGKFIEGNFLCG